MYRLRRVATKELNVIIENLEWLKDDSKECLELAGWDIPTIILKQQRTEPVNFVVENDGVIYSIIIIALDGSLTYFNTTAMEKHSISYLRFLKPQLDMYIKLFDIELVTEVASWYTTSIKKLKLLGFTLVKDNINRIEYGKQNKDS